MKTTTKFTCPAFAALALVCFAVLSTAQAVNPPPDGGYTGWNTAEGQDALFHLTTGGFNTAIGGHALYGNTTGISNTAVGAFSLAANSSGYQNVAIGQGALRYNTDGLNNTGVGFQALLHNTTADNNTAIGFDALYNNHTSPANTAIGYQALFNTRSVYQFSATGGNTAIGYQALFSNRNTGGSTAIGYQALFNYNSPSGGTAIGYQALYQDTANYNTAIGVQALFSNSNPGGADAFANTAIGYQSLLNNTSAQRNTAVGAWALNNSDDGGGNTAIGEETLYHNIHGGRNVALGLGALFNTKGSSNIAVGAEAGRLVATADNVICIGHEGANVSNTTWIANIYDVTTQNATTAPVIVSADGQLGTAASSERFKKDIATMDSASEVILSLRPVTFHYKTDSKGTPQFGLIAEEVAKVNPALVLPDKEGKPYTVRYEAVNAMLLNEFLKEHRTVQQQGATIAELKKQIEALTAGLQKVSAQLELSKAAPQTVKNND